MSWHDWAKAGWLRPHQTSRRQIADLFAIVDRDLEDATRGLSADWQFGIAYNAVLKLCTILVYTLTRADVQACFSSPQLIPGSTGLRFRA